MTHELKVAPMDFEAVKNGVKTFELCFNDRNYRVNDCIIVRECKEGECTGRERKGFVLYVLYSHEGLKSGWVIMAIEWA